jgi:hypothetical protein
MATRSDASSVFDIEAQLQYIIMRKAYGDLEWGGKPIDTVIAAMQKRIQEAIERKEDSR